MTRFLISAATLIVFTAGANADIVCTRSGGCWETHKKIRRNGDRWLEHTIPSKTNPSVMVKKRLQAEGDFPARSPEDRR